MKSSGVITLLSDFGLQDPYVGVMKGVILQINPQARLVDLTHRIEAGDIAQGAACLAESHRYFPAGSIHLAVVDPGVGTERRPLAVLAAGHAFVGPDNGLFSPIIDQDPSTRVVHLSERRFFRPQVSPTFHGRDIFAPVAAHLSLGVDPSELGPWVTDAVTLTLPEARSADGILVGRVSRVDRFGNLISNIRESALSRHLAGAEAEIRAAGLRIRGLHRTYGEVAPGEVLALVGSSGTLEIAVREGSAAKRLESQAGRLTGLPVEVRRRRPED